MIVVKVLSYIFMFGLGATASALYFKQVVAEAKADVAHLADEFDFYYQKYKSALKALPKKTASKL